MADRFWVGGTGNWSDLAHWSLVSGGTGGESIPEISTDAHFDALSFTAPGQVVSLSTNAPAYLYCHDLDFTGALYNPSFLFDYENVVTSEEFFEFRIFLYVSGNLTFIEDMTVDGVMGDENNGMNITFVGVNQEIITPVSNSNIKYTISTLGTFDFMSDLPSCYLTWIEHTFGQEGELVVRTNNFDITCFGFGGEVSIPLGVALGSSVVRTGIGDETLFASLFGDTFAFTDNGGTLDFDAGTSHIIANGGTGMTTFGASEFLGELALNFYNVTLMNAGGEAFQYVMARNIHFLRLTAGGRYLFDSSEPYVGILSARGSSSSPITMTDLSDFVPESDIWTWVQTSGRAICDYVILRGSQATGGARFYAGAHSTDVSGNTGWLFMSPPPSYSKVGVPYFSGIYTLGGYSGEYPVVLDLTYPISQLDSEGAFVTWNVEIGSILVVGNDFYASWKRTDEDGVVTYGVDKLDYTLKTDKAYIETRILGGNRSVFATFFLFALAYSELPDNTSIDLYYSTDYGTTWIQTTTTIDTVRKIIKAEESPEATIMQLRAVFNVDTNQAPAIESGYIVLE